MIRMMDSENSIIGPINIGNPIEFSMIDLANIILKLTKSNSKIVYLPLPEDDPIRRRPDIKLASKKLKGWKPKVAIDDGLLKTINYFEKILTSNN